MPRIAFPFRGRAGRPAPGRALLIGIGTSRQQPPQNLKRHRDGPRVQRPHRHRVEGAYQVSLRVGSRWVIRQEPVWR